MLVVFVVFVFLQSWRTTIIPTIAIPVSLIATLAVMQVLGFSLNMLSLLGMVLAIGLVVDDAIVVVENVERQLEAGLPPPRRRARGDGGSHGADHRDDRGADGGVRAGRLHSRRRGAPLQSIRADRRDFGRHFGLQFAHPQSGAERRHAASRAERDRSSSSAGSTRASTGCRTPTPGRCDGSSASAGPCSASSSLIVAARLWPVAAGLASTFLPVEDQGYFFVVVQGPDGASLERTDAVAKKVRDILQATPGVDIVGFDQRPQLPDQRRAVEFGGGVRDPEALGERGPEESASPIVAQVRPKLLGIPEAFALSFDPPSIHGLGATGGFEFEVEDLAGAAARR